MAENLRRLLDYIIENAVMKMESRTAQLDATAVQDIPAEIRSISDDHKADAQRLAPYFEQGMRMAAANNGRVTVDDTDPTGNGIADAFARYLVTSDLASSQSTEIGQGHYRYTFDLDWPAIEALAGRAGVDLKQATRG
ncbi:MAG TPA: hypothetical protein VFR15_05855 [Chloroflexia bacterium]|nr:hypothetical protein [Chloroflexia bacterium]